MKISENCNICNSNSFLDKGIYKDMLYGHDGEWQIVKCDSCSHECIFPLPSDEYLESLYAFEQYYSFGTVKINKFIKFIRENTRKLLPKNIKDKNFLDYGCGDGEVLKIIKEKAGNAFGLEFGENARNVRNATGLDVYETPKESWYGNMDFVRSFHSLEHIKNPKETMQLFKDLIKPESGRIMIGVPNVDSMSAKIFDRFYFYRGAPLHLQGFSVRSISMLANSLNLEIVSVKTPGGFRGILGSINIFIQNLIHKSSREPSNISLLLMFPIYLVLLPIIIPVNFFKKGDVLEIILKKNDT